VRDTIQIANQGGRAASLAATRGSPLDIALEIVGQIDGASQQITQANTWG